MLHLLAPKENRCFLKQLWGLAAAVVFGAASPSALAAGTLWKTPSGDWFNSTFWTAGVPTTSSEAQINNGGTVFVNTTGAKSQFILVGGDVGTSGTLEIGAGGSLSSSLGFGVGIGGSSSGTLRVVNGGTLSTFGGSVGSDRFSTGTVLLDGAGSSWTISQPSLYLAHAGTANLTVSNGALLRVGGGTGSVVMAEDRYGVTNLYIGTGGAAGTIEAGDIYGLQDLESGLGGTATITFNHNEANYQFNPAIYDNTSVKHIGPGRTVLMAPENNYFLATTITAGQFYVQNGLAGRGAVDVGPAGTFGGKGTVNGLTTVEGMLVPGIDGIGRLTFTSDLTLDSTAVVKLELGGQVRGVTFDAIDLTANLAYGGILQLSLANGFEPHVGDTFRLFSGFTAFSGAFSAIEFAQPGFAATFNHATGILAITSVPEPSLGGLLAAGLFVLGVARRPKCI